MNVSKEAQKDAAEYARAQMFHGEGAGVRRRLIHTQVEFKSGMSEEYANAFHRAMEKQNMAEHAKKAVKERKRIDRSATVSKNVKGILTGNNQSVNTGVLVVSLLAYVAHRTGYDKVIYEKAKAKYEDFKRQRRINKRVKDAGKPGNFTIVN